MHYEKSIKNFPLRDIEDRASASFVIALMRKNDETFILLTNHAKRGLQIPGGRKEAGEDSVITGVRELHEETGCIVSLDTSHYVGCVEWKTSDPKPEDYRYPYPVGYMPFFCVDIYKINDVPSAPITEIVGVSLVNVKYVFEHNLLNEYEREIIRSVLK